MSAALRTLFEEFGRTTVLVVGDVMLDAYAWGKVERISPEAPVPVVRVTQRSARLGGAANVALNVKALGATAIVVSALGNDENGTRMEGLFHQAGLTTKGAIRSSARTTTVKTRVISGHQHIVRVDEEMDEPLSDADEQAILDRIASVLKEDKPGVVILEDYNKGVLTPAVIKGTIERAKTAGIPVAVDPKKENFFAYRGVDLFKPNLKELREGLKIDLTAGDHAAVSAALEQLEQRLGNAASLLTLSEHGMVARRGTEEVFLPAHKREIADVSGAGDTVIAVAALCLARRVSLSLLAALSNLAGGLVCEYVGVVPIDRAQLLSEAERTLREA
jgi:rfaE bifunctional protein kinase chain/domain